jgi:hypothetical protein
MRQSLASKMDALPHPLDLMAGNDDRKEGADPNEAA